MAYINKIIVNGQEVNANQLEGILDKDGHNRFIEGDLTVATKEGVTATYSKWSLSGTHLMLVLAITIDNAVEYANGDDIFSVDLPQWIRNKIFPTRLGIIEYKAVTAIGQDYSTQSFSTYLWKDGALLKLNKSGALTLSAERSLRIQFDLLIDNA